MVRSTAFVAAVLALALPAQPDTITSDFTTADFGLDSTISLQLIAGNGFSRSTLAGSATEQAFGSGDWGLGATSFNSGGASFDTVQIVILPSPGSDFLADNFVVTTAAPVSLVPEPSGLAVVGIALRVLCGLRFSPRLASRY